MGLFKILGEISIGVARLASSNIEKGIAYGY